MVLNISSTQLAKLGETYAVAATHLIEAISAITNCPISNEVLVIPRDHSRKAIKFQ